MRYRVINKVICADGLACLYLSGPDGKTEQIIGIEHWAFEVGDFVLVEPRGRCEKPRIQKVEYLDWSPSPRNWLSDKAFNALVIAAAFLAMLVFCQPADAGIVSGVKRVVKFGPRLAKNFKNCLPIMVAYAWDPQKQALKRRRQREERQFLMRFLMQEGIGGKVPTEDI